MRPLKRWFVISASTAIAAMLIGDISCSCARKNPAAPPTGSGAKEGLWVGTFTITSVPGSGTCGPSTAAFVDTFYVLGGSVSDLIVPSCDAPIVGSQFRQMCRDTLENSPDCVVVETLIGDGSLIGGTFSGTWTLTFAKTGACPAWDHIPSCTYRIRGTGFWRKDLPPTLGPRGASSPLML